MLVIDLWGMFDNWFGTTDVIINRPGYPGWVGRYLDLTLRDELYMAVDSFRLDAEKNTITIYLK